MKRYELVVLIDQKLSQKSIDSLVSEIKDLFGDGVKDEDNIGMLDIVYPINGAKRAYFLSLLLELESDSIKKYKKQISLKKGVQRFFFYNLGKDEKFLKFAEVNKAFELSEEEKEKQENQNAFQDMDSSSKATY